MFWMSRKSVWTEEYDNEKQKSILTNRYKHSSLMQDKTTKRLQAIKRDLKISLLVLKS